MKYEQVNYIIHQFAQQCVMMALSLAGQGLKIQKDISVELAIVKGALRSLLFVYAQRTSKACLSSSNGWS